MYIKKRMEKKLKILPQMKAFKGIGSVWEEVLKREPQSELPPNAPPINEVIAGMAMGLLIQIYDKRSDLFHPEVSYCGISIKDKHRLDNSHKDHEDRKDYIKILGLLNSDCVD